MFNDVSLKSMKKVGLNYSIVKTFECFFFVWEKVL